VTLTFQNNSIAWIKCQMTLSFHCDVAGMH